jgi:hypothetical protein
VTASGLRIVPAGPPERLRTIQFHAFERLRVTIEEEAAS